MRDRDVLVRGAFLHHIGNTESNNVRFVGVRIEYQRFNGFNVLLNGPMANYSVIQSDGEYPQVVPVREYSLDASHRSSNGRGALPLGSLPVARV
jgi:hypothetical protein